MPKRPHSAGELADAHVFRRCVEAGEVALHFGIPVEQLEPKGGGLGVDAVGATDGGRVLELESAALEHGQEGDDAGANELRRLLDLQRLGCVDNVI